MALEGHEIKLSRAYQGLYDLKLKIRIWLDSDNQRIIRKRDPNNSERFVVHVAAKPIPKSEFGPLIGEILHNLRGSLDHLAYSLALANKKILTKKMAKDSEFPIIGDEHGKGAGWWKDALARKVVAVDPKAQAEIREVQPYLRGKDYEAHPLWLLHALNNIDKHRLLLVAACANIAGALMPDQGRNVATLGPFTVGGGFIEGETEVLSYFARPIDSSREMYVPFEPVIGIAFRGESVVEGRDVLSTVGGVYDYIVTTVLPSLARFL